jgi:hypothetical protein
MNTLQSDVRLYVRKARKTRGIPISFAEFNIKYKTKLPEGAQEQYETFRASLKKASKANGFPIQGRLFNLYRALSREATPVVPTSLKRELIPPPTQSLSPTDNRSLQQVVKKPRIEEKPAPVEVVEEIKVQEKVEAEPYTMAHFKSDLALWKVENPGSKLHKETQVVYFVANEKVNNFEHFAAKLTRNTGSILETGGIFKMRSGLKKEILGMDKKVAQDIVASVTNGGKGPFFLPISCVTGAENCNCKL